MSQLGYIVLPMDANGNAIPSPILSYKARRLTGSVMAAQVIAFSDLFYTSFTLLSELQVLLSREIPLHLLTDSKCLFDVISKGPRASEKNDVKHRRNARWQSTTRYYECFGRSSRNIADVLTEKNETGCPI